MTGVDKKNMTGYLDGNYLIYIILFHLIKIFKNMNKNKKINILIFKMINTIKILQIIIILKKILYMKIEIT